MSLRILLVDDDPIVREVVSSQLQALGHTVAVAATAATALATARSQHFDLLLIDQRLDGEDGSALLPALREIDETRCARMIAISADLDDQRAQNLLARGFDAALEKPIAIGRLRDVLSDHSPSPAASLDDAAALAIWGSIDTVRTLRGMLRDELPVYRGMLEAAAMTRDLQALRDALHRMKSSAGFCGAIPLIRFIDDTARQSDAWTTLIDRYDQACSVLMPDLQAALAT
ncbi:MAG: response regulator [Rhodanobacteraceae bacterium]|nr:response regulator [Rhodanobacteraceae bacterium]MBK7042287.1 response regulator [Rhodanobacteraceae bacterium]MBP9153833.1 response regulator [Xanthomonadales bacterium]HQW80695.1 response regulator [Pseudomonadota bacterium]